MSALDCTWQSPGAAPYTGTKAAAVAYYTDIPSATRAKLLARMERNQFDEVVEIRRDDIGGGRYEGLERMHFSTGRVCGTVDRSGWTAWEHQPALVYCEDGHCLIEPVICHNVSYVRRSAQKPAAEAVPPLVFDAPAAGETETAPIATPTDIGTAESFETAATPPGGYAAAWPSLGPTLPYGGGYGIPNSPGAVSPVPEPSTYALMALGLIVITGARIKRNRPSLTNR